MEKSSILIVDDEYGVRESLRLILEPQYDVQTASSALEALSYLDEKEFSLVISDLRMPGLSGFDLLETVKKLKKQIDVLIVTGFGTLPNARKAINYGAAGLLSKPFNVVDVVMSVNKIFVERKQRMDLENLIKKAKDLSHGLPPATPPSA